MRQSKLKYLLILPFLCLSLWALSWGLADLFAYQAGRYERSWQAEGVENLDEWNKAKYWALLSSKLNGSHPDYLDTLGRIYYWRFFVKSDPIKSLEEQNEYLNQGLIQFRSAIEKRPTWPLTWVRLVKLKSLVGNIDDEYWYAWAKAQELGRWESFVQEELLGSGFQYWGSFTKDQQSKVLSVLSDMFSKPYSQLSAFALVDMYGLSAVICSRLNPELIDSVRVMRRRCLSLK